MSTNYCMRIIPRPNNKNHIELIGEKGCLDYFMMVSKVLVCLSIINTHIKKRHATALVGYSDSIKILNTVGLIFPFRIEDHADLLSELLNEYGIGFRIDNKSYGSVNRWFYVELFFTKTSKGKYYYTRRF